MEFIEYSLEGLRDESVRLAETVERGGYRPDCVAYLARGGWLIGEAVAEYFGAPLIELSAHRSGDVAKERGASLLSRLPRPVRKALREWEIKRRLSGDSGETQRKSVRLTDRYDVPAGAQRILLVDDSADTGESLAEALEVLGDSFPSSEQRIAVINVFERAQRSVPIDWWLHKDTMMSLPSSKDNRRYREFSKMYSLLDANNEEG